MKIKFGALVVDGRGKIGGHVASKNRSGAYLRTKVTPVNPNTSAQSAVRSRLGDLSQAWKSLTQEQRNAWNAAVQSFAKTDIFGDLKNPSGLNLYVRLNSNLINAGASAIATPPLPTGADTIAILDFTAQVTGDVLILDTLAAVPANTSLVVRTTPLLSPGINFVKSEYRQIEVFPAGTASGSINIFLSFTERFGALVAGQKVFAEVMFVNTDTGEVSVKQSYTAIVAA